MLGRLSIRWSSDGLSGGLITFWDPSLLSLLSQDGDKHWLRTRCKLKPQDAIISIINIYAPHAIGEKLALWERLRDLLEELPDDRVCLIRDFNSVRDASERSNCIYRDSDSKYLNEFIRNLELHDIRSFNSTFTWCGRNGKRSKLDRCLLNWNWFEKETWQVRVLDRKNSDHRAILLNTYGCLT